MPDYLIMTYSFMHLIARDSHQSIVDMIKADVLEGWGK